MDASTGAGRVAIKMDDEKYMRSHPELRWLVDRFVEVRHPLRSLPLLSLCSLPLLSPCALSFVEASRPQSALSALRAV